MWKEDVVPGSGWPGCKTFVISASLLPHNTKIGLATAAYAADRPLLQAASLQLEGGSAMLLRGALELGRFLDLHPHRRRLLVDTGRPLAGNVHCRLLLLDRAAVSDQAGLQLLPFREEGQVSDHTVLAPQLLLLFLELNSAEG